MPLLRTLLSHTSPTGYSRKGGVVAQDVEGLQAYTDWLQRELRASRTAEHLSPPALQALTLAAEQAQDYLRALPDDHLHKRATDRVKADLEAQLLRHVPRGHALYPRFFPEQVRARVRAKPEPEPQPQPQPQPESEPEPEPEPQP